MNSFKQNGPTGDRVGSKLRNHEQFAFFSRLTFPNFRYSTQEALLCIRLMRNYLQIYTQYVCHYFYGIHTINNKQYFLYIASVDG